MQHELRCPVALRWPAVTGSILILWHVSVLQSPFLINQLCDPSLHPSSSTNSSSKALNSVNLWVQTGNGLLKHTKSNSMDSVFLPQPKLITGLPTCIHVHTSARASPEQPPASLTHFLWHVRATALPGCSAGSKLWSHPAKRRCRLRKKVEKPTHFWVQLWKHSICSLLRMRTFCVKW